MICLPYIVAGKYQVAQFKRKQERVPTFVVERTKKSEKILLFYFVHDLVAFDSDKGTGENNINDYILSFEKVEVNEKDVSIFFKKDSYDPSKVKNNSWSEPTKDKDEIIFVENGEVFLDLNKIDISDIISYSIVLKIPEESLEYRFDLNISRPNNICDIVIDFGSEASQISVSYRNLNQQSVNAVIPLFSNICDSYANSEKVKILNKLGESIEEEYQTNDNNKYYQQDLDETLYKSLYFLSEDINREGIEEEDFVFLNRIGDLKEILKKYIALPNLKLIDYNDVQLPIIRLKNKYHNIYHYQSEIRKLILNFFIKNALEYVNSLNGNLNKACRLVFLIPNTYTQQEATNVRFEIMDYVSNLCQKKDELTNIKGGVEVCTFSESDASFFGMPNITGTKDGKKYLIIDIGKGTTDFSVLKVTNGPGGKDVSRLARSGIVGAGNVMTFAVFASVLQSILKANGKKNTLIKETVSKVLFGNGNVDRAHKNALYLLVEQLKQMPISNTRKDIDSFLIDYYKGKQLEKIDDLDIEYVNEIIEKLLKNHCYIKDNDLMGKYANAISSTLIEELRNIYNEHVDIDEVIFSGRGSLCDILRRSIYEELRKTNPKLIDPDILQELTPKRLKMNCLYGPLTRDMFYDRENINIIGWPLLRRKSERISVTKHKHQKKNKGIFATKRGMEDETKGLYSRERTNKEGIGLLANFQGESVQLGDADCYFSLGNRNYTIDNQIHKDLYGSDLSVQIFFEGEDFVLRTKDDIFRLTPRGDDKDYSLLYETLFPMTEGNADLQYKKGFKTLQESTEANSNENDPNTTAQNKIIQDFLKNI